MAEAILYNALCKYYTAHPHALDTLQSPPVSLRALDWLCTNYSKANTVILNGTTDLYGSYRQWLSVFSKSRFDPFARGRRIHFERCAKTTLGQLNFFRWAAELGVTDYARRNIWAIERHMAIQLQRSREILTAKRRQLTQPRSVEPVYPISAHVYNRVGKRPPKPWELELALDPAPDAPQQNKEVECSGHPLDKHNGTPLDQVSANVCMVEPEG